MLLALGGLAGACGSEAAPAPEPAAAAPVREPAAAAAVEPEAEPAPPVPPEPETRPPVAPTDPLSDPSASPSSAPSTVRAARVCPIDASDIDAEPGLFDAARAPGEAAPERAADATERGADAAPRSRRWACAEGCVLVGPDGSAVATMLADVEESGLPTHVEVVRWDAAGISSTSSISTSALSADALYGWAEEGGEPPWSAAVARAMRGTSAWTSLPDVAGARGTIDFSLSSCAVVRGLGAPLDGWLLFAERAADATRFHLVRRDCSDEWLVGSLPHEAGACDGDGGAALCVIPPSIERVFVTADATLAFAQVDFYPAGHGGAFRRFVRLELEGHAPAAGAPSPELLAALEAPGARPRWLGPWAWLEPGVPLVGPEPLVAGALSSRCDWECAFFGAGHELLVRPTEVAGNAAPAALVVTRDGTETVVPVEGEVPFEEADMPWHARTVAALGSLEGLRPARDLVRREATASDHDLVVTPLVELGAPLLGVMLWLETDGERYVLHRRAAGADDTVGSAPALLRDGAPARGGIARVYADGARLVVLGYARTGELTTRFFVIRA